MADRCACDRSVAMAGYDKWFHGSNRDAQGKISELDLYPRHEVPKEELQAETKTLIDFAIDVKNRTMKYVAFKEEDLLKFGMNSNDHTSKRKRPHDDITDSDVRNLLGDMTIPEFVKHVRKSILDALADLRAAKVVIKGAGQWSLQSAADLPGEGTGLPQVYRNIEYRLMRLATFQHTNAAGKAAAMLRSLEKLACADWCEQGPDWAHERAVQVRSLHTGVVL